MNERAERAERPRRTGRPRLAPDQPSVTVCVRLPEAALNRLTGLATKHRVSVSAELRALVLLTVRDDR